MSSKKRTNSIIGSIVGVGVIGLVVATMTIPSTAAFTDTKPASVDISTATLTLGVSDADNSGTIDLDFNNLKPGDLKTQSFNVRNDGTIAGTVNVGSGFTDSVSPSNPNVTYQNLRVGAGAASGSIALSASNALPAGGWDLGVLQPGEQKTFFFDVKLGAGAGNEWKGQSFGGNIPVTLTQQ